ncbi:MAG: hypothetical protein J6A74_06860 [Oscillospiraceae bacterium]|nr:hypothetical protein [Oscillospiraceae bacterium]
MSLNFSYKKKVKKDKQGFMAQRRMIMGEHSPFLLQEAYKTLRTNIRFALQAEGCKKCALPAVFLVKEKALPS